MKIWKTMNSLKDSELLCHNWMFWKTRSWEKLVLFSQTTLFLILRMFFNQIEEKLMLKLVYYHLLKLSFHQDLLVWTHLKFLSSMLLTLLQKLIKVWSKSKKKLKS